MWSTYGLDSGIQFRHVEANGVGIQSVLDLGYKDAIDVWGYAEQGYGVCFPEGGQLFFLDAANSPRTATAIDSYTENGFTCVTLDRAGTVVLVESPLPASLAQATIETGSVLTNCMVTTNYMLNFRDGPGGMLLDDLIPYDVTLTALRRTIDWFKVDYMGAPGWIAAEYVTTQGTCG